MTQAGVQDAPACHVCYTLLIMSAIDLYQLFRRIPDVTEDQAKAAADSIAQADQVATKHDLEATRHDLKTEIARLEAKLTRLIFSAAAVVIAAIGVAAAVIIGSVGAMIQSTIS